MKARHTARWIWLLPTSVLWILLVAPGTYAWHEEMVPGLSMQQGMSPDLGESGAVVWREPVPDAPEGPDSPERWQVFYWEPGWGYDSCQVTQGEHTHYSPRLEGNSVYWSEPVTEWFEIPDPENPGETIWVEETHLHIYKSLVPLSPGSVVQPVRHTYGRHDYSSFDVATGWSGNLVIVEESGRRCSTNGLHTVWREGSQIYCDGAAAFTLPEGCQALAHPSISSAGEIVYGYLSDRSTPILASNLRGEILRFGPGIFKIIDTGVNSSGEIVFEGIWGYFWPEGYCVDKWVPDAGEEPPPGQAPVLLPLPPQSACVGRQYVCMLRATGTWPIRYEVVAGPPGLSVDNNGRVTWMPGIQDVGEHQVTVRVENFFGSATLTYMLMTVDGIVYLDKEACDRGDWRAVSGAAADGESQVIIWIPGVSDINSLTVTPEVGKRIETRQLPDGAAGVVWQAPEVLEGFLPDLDWIDNGWKQVGFRIEVTGEAAFDAAPFYLAKPPVVLVHGGWSNAGAFAEMARFLRTAYCPMVDSVNYPSEDHFADNVPIVRNELRARIRELAHHGIRDPYKDCQVPILIGQADVVAHSMGGILMNLYVASGDYGGEVNRLVTIGTPHSGSELANYILHFLYADMEEDQRQAWVDILDMFGRSLTKGATYDLQVGSPAMDQYAEACSAVPGLAIEGANEDPEGASLGVALLYFLLYGFDVRLDPSHSHFDGVYDYSNYTQQRVEDGLFRAVATKWETYDSDLIVSTVSQQGGCGALRQATVLDHMEETADMEVIQRVVETLNSPVTALDETGFKPLADYPVPSVGWVDLPAGVGECTPYAHDTTGASSNGLLDIVSPAPAAIFRPGDTLTVEVSYDGPSDQTVFCVAHWTAPQMDTSAPYEFEFVVSTDSIGLMPIAAWTWNEDGTSETAAVQVRVLPAEAPISIEVIPSPPLYLQQGSECGLSVLGTYSDGVTRDITSPAAGTTYMSSDTSVVTVSTDGVIAALFPGYATVTVKNLLSVEAPVFVDYAQNRRYVPQQYISIQSAIDAAGPGDMVIVDRGVYLENIDFKGKAISVQSWHPEDPDTVAATIIDGHSAGPCVTFSSGETAGSVLAGFTVMNGSGLDAPGTSWADPCGGGVYCKNSSPTIRGCVIAGNSVEEEGGGIYCYEGAPVISHNTVVGNTAVHGGGGIYCYHSSPSITGNTITGNGAFDEDGGVRSMGGGIYCYKGSPVISHNTVLRNSATYRGGGIHSGSASTRILNNLIAENNVSGEYSSGGGITCGESDVISNNTVVGNMAVYHGGGIRCSSSTLSNNIVAFNSSGVYNPWGGTPALRDNCVFGNTSYNYSGLSAGPGDITEDPLFVDRVAGDYHLATGSPCIDAGYDDAIEIGTDIDGESRIMGGHVDIGADEFLGVPKVAPLFFNPEGGLYNSVQSVTISSPTNGAVIHYTTNGNDPTVDDPTIDSGASVLVDRSLALRAWAWKPNWASSDIKTALYTLKVATPMFAPDGGVYGMPQSVTISCATEGAVIHYTANGSEPTESDPVVIGPVLVKKSLILKARAYKVGFDVSDVKSAAYTITISPIALAKTEADGSPVAVSAAVVSAAFADFFYMEADDRSSGIRVEKVGHGLTEGVRADVAGSVETNPDGERYIAADSASSSGTGAVSPVGLTNKSLGGGDWLYDPVSGGGQKGIASAYGLNNVGLLIRTWGTVTQIGADYLYIDDGSNLRDGTYTDVEENIGVRVICDPAGYASGDHVEVTGISSCFEVAPGQIARRILTRRAEDVRKVDGP